MKSIYTKNIFLISLVFLISIFVFSSKTSADIENPERDQRILNETNNPDLEKELRQRENQLTEQGTRLAPTENLEDLEFGNFERDSLQIRTITNILDLEGVFITPDNARAQGYKILNSFFEFLIKLIAFLSVVSIAFVCFKLVYNASVGNVNEYATTKKELKNIIVAIVIMLTAWLFLNTLNSDLLNIPKGVQVDPSSLKQPSDSPSSIKEPSLKNLGEGIADEKNARNCVFLQQKHC